VSSWRHFYFVVVRVWMTRTSVDSWSHFFFADVRVWTTRTCVDSWNHFYFVVVRWLDDKDVDDKDVRGLAESFHFV